VNEHSAMLHPAATDHLPFFITAPGETDGLFNAMVVFLIVVVFAVGLIYLRLHALPEHLAHGASKVQLQLVSVLALLALFTHNHIFWIAALLVALVQFPNFSAPLASMAQSLEKMAGRPPPSETRAPIPDAEVTTEQAVPWSPAAETAPEQAVPQKPVAPRKVSIARAEAAPAVPEKVS
jgi:hypothetical protein